MITLQPSAAKTSAVARPMPFEPPVIRAVLPASFKSMGCPWERAREANYGGALAPQQQRCGKSGARRDHAANPLAVADLRAKTEVACCCLDVEQTTRGLWFRGVDIELHRIPGGRAGGGDIVRSDSLGMRHEVGKLLARVREARRDAGIRRVVDVNVRPVGERRD